MTRVVFARDLALAALTVSVFCLPSQALQAQTQSIEEAPGYRTVPEPEPQPGALLGVPEGGATFGDSTLVIQAPGYRAPDPAIGGQGQPGLSQPGVSASGVERVSPVTFSPRQLAAFAKTAVQVQTVAQLWQPVIDDAITTAEATNLGQQANAEKIRAIEDLGLIGPATYARINDAARVDPDLRAEIAALYEAAVQRLPKDGGS